MATHTRFASCVIIEDKEGRMAASMVPASCCYNADTESHTSFPIQLQDWLGPLDAAPVECDGLSRVISALLLINGLEHTVRVGWLVDTQRLGTDPVSSPWLTECPHFWIELPSGHIVDFRARMWMGPDAQHGVFLRHVSRLEYRCSRAASFAQLPVQLLSVMCGVNLEAFPPFLRE